MIFSHHILVLFNLGLNITLLIFVSIQLSFNHKGDKSCVI